VEYKLLQKIQEAKMLVFQDEEIMKGEKKIAEWRSKIVRLQGHLNNASDNISDQFVDMLLKLDEMKIKVEELKNPGSTSFETIRDEIIEIDVHIGREYDRIQRKLYS
jgi:predicted  nucleic acid-binding Zn-ribbon protein